MAIEFTVRADPDADLVSAIAAANPRSPFLTPAYAAAQRALGNLPCAFILQGECDTLNGTLGFISGGSHVRQLSVPTWPATKHSATLNDGILAFCRHESIAYLDIENFATVSSEPLVPPCGNARIVERSEFIIGLRAGEEAAGWSSNHRRNLRKAEKAGLTITISSDPEDATVHLGMQQGSALRRKGRGESVELPTSPTHAAALIDADAGHLFQAKLGGETIASVLVLESAAAGYYHSAGASLRGMRAGASTMLVLAAGRFLAANGCIEFNLGGAGASEPGLRRFKCGFGALERPLHRYACRIASRPAILARRIRQKLGQR